MKTRLIVNIHSISVGILERMPVTCPQVFDLHFQSATGLHCSKMRNGPLYQGASFPFTPKRDTPFIGDTFR